MKRWILAIAAAAAIHTASGALAQDEESAGESRAATFEAATGAQREEVPGGALMIGAYTVAWLLVLGYVASLGLRHARTQADLERLRRDLAARDGKS